MAAGKGPDISGKRLTRQDYAANFADLHPPLDDHEALVEADRCYFCHDAPCMTACPTSIDIPMFIREIQAGHPKSAARTIFDQNILGGMCARVCPTKCISGVAKKLHVIDQSKCIHCGECHKACRFSAIAVD